MAMVLQKYTYNVGKWFLFEMARNKIKFNISRPHHHPELPEYAPALPLIIIMPAEDAPTQMAK